MLKELPQQSTYLQLIPQANPIQKKTLVSPQSIFPQFPLPQFTYTEQQQQTYPIENSLKKQIMELQQTNFGLLFNKPLYQSNSKLKTINNLQYATINARYQQSKTNQLALQQNSVGFQQNQLQFESRFESGNLAFVTKSSKNENQYYLLLQKDTNTRKCTQWFFFKVNNNNFCGKVTFHIINFIKNYSIFENGMKIALCSQSNGYRWIRGCNDITYLKTNILENNNRHYYSLNFSYNFQKKNDQTYFAYSYPYTFSMLDRYLLKVSENYSKIVKRKTLTNSPGGNYIDMLTITNVNDKKKYKKKIVYITARVHPGETPSSFVMEGIIDFLISDCPQADSIRDNFILRLIPMLNPDGVINGNYRCSLSGNDLNRVWHYPSPQNHPQIYTTKKQIYQGGDCFMIIDLHAHSKKKGIFMYGCQNRINPYICRHIPYLLWKNIPEFNYYQCNFSIKTGRQGTLRLAIWRMLGIEYIYTMQHSFCGSSKNKTHFTVQKYKQIGNSLLKTLQKYYCRKNFLQDNKDIFTQLYTNKQLINQNQDDNSSSSDSQLQIIIDNKLQNNNSKNNKKLIAKRQKNVGKQQTKIIMYKTSKFKQATSEFNVTKYYPVNSHRLSPPKINGQLPLPVILPDFKDQNQIHSGMERTKYFKGCFSSLPQKKQIPEPRLIQHSISLRYSGEEQVNSLSNLFLPSLTKVSYKKYAKNTKYQKMIQIGKPLSDRTIMKQQIKSVQKRKPNWKQQMRNVL